MKRWTALALAAPLVAVLPAAGGAQEETAAGGARTTVGGRSEVFAGSEVEGYLRYLQTLGVVAPQPWSIRAFSPGQLDRILPDSAASHPWRARYDLAAAPGRRPRRGLALDYVRPAATVYYNSAFPYGSNDGPVWAGRGITTAVQSGVAARWGVASLVLAPTAFRAENGGFTLAPAAGRSPYADLRFPFNVDRPRRFGSEAYARIDPGQSTLNVDAGPLALGASTANQTWGPGDRYPLIVGNNAAGFPHVFVGTSKPADLWLVKLSTRLVWGRLDQSGQSPVVGSESFVSIAQPGTRRFASGLVAAVQPRGVPGLEIGGARFFHSPWREGGPTSRDFGKPFEAFYKEDALDNPDNPIDISSDFDNQLASAFFRWVLPRSGFELAGELYKEDHNYDVRDLVLEPDHNAGYAISARKAFRRSDGSVIGVRAEVVSLDVSPLGQRRQQGLNYVGGYLRQGHTQRGQLIGADLGVGSTGGSTVGADWYTRGGQWSAWWSRTLRQENVGVSNRGLAPVPDVAGRRSLDVAHALGLDARLFRGAVDVVAGTAAVLNFNREFRRDVFNLSARLGARYNLR
jgi:hypothetical protein